MAPQVTNFSPVASPTQKRAGLDSSCPTASIAASGPAFTTTSRGWPFHLGELRLSLYPHSDLSYLLSTLCCRVSIHAAASVLAPRIAGNTRPALRLVCDNFRSTKSGRHALPHACVGVLTVATTARHATALLRAATNTEGGCLSVTVLSKLLYV